MAKVFLSLGSNVNRQQNIRGALDVLGQTFGTLDVSPVYESESVGFDGDNFYNLVVALDTTLAVGNLSQCLKRIERDFGRIHGEKKFCNRTLDIDILTYDDLVGTIDGVQLPRDEIKHNAFVLWPLENIAADVIHPQLQCSYGALWDDFDKLKQKLWVVDLLAAE